MPIRCFLYCSILILIISSLNFANAAPAKNVILFIGDGMGLEQVKAAGMYANGEPNTLSFEAFAHKALVTTYSVNSSVTDSAAAATAIATGHKVNNRVISMAFPGDHSELETLLEYAKSLDKKTGLVTTVYISHATPAGFGAHENDRDNYNQIVDDYLNQTRPNILFGAANYITIAQAAAAGYQTVTNYSTMSEVDTNTVTYISGQFGTNQIPYEYDGVGNMPHLSEMTATALDILDNEPNGFFLMVEGGTIDWACHGNDEYRAIPEVVELANSVQVAIDWATGRTDTTIIVTADHETGGMTVDQNNGKGNFPTVSWSIGDHTGANVGLWAWGVNAPLVSGILDNTDFFAICTLNEVGFGDFDNDNKVTFSDFAFFASRWNNQGCVFPDYCETADLDLSGEINYQDLAILVENWLEGAEP